MEREIRVADRHGDRRVSGTATCTVDSDLAVGTDAITATYSGDSNHNGNSSTLSGGQVVSQASTNATGWFQPESVDYAKRSVSRQTWQR